MLALTACGRLGEAEAPGPDQPTSTEVPAGEPPTEPQSSPVTPQPGTLSPRPVAWTRIDIADDDRTLVVHFVGGVESCYRLDRVEVAYGRHEITVTVYEGAVPDLPPDTACIEIGVLKSVAVQLDEPLAGRALEDGAG